MADAAKDLKSDDPQKREKAAKKLGEIEQTAKDDQARKDAKEALKDAGANGEDGDKPERSRAVRKSRRWGSTDKPGDEKSGKGGEPLPMGDKTPMDNPKEGTDKGKGQPQARRIRWTRRDRGKGGRAITTTSLTMRKSPDKPPQPATPETPVEQMPSVLQLRKVPGGGRF